MHRRESILQALLTTLTGLTTTGTNVKRARAYAVPSSPAITISQGADVLLEDWEMASIGRRLSVDITAHVQVTTNLETDLNQISAEVYAAMTADRTQGLAYVFDTNIEAESAPDIGGGDTEKPVARIIMTYALDYEHSDTSAEA